MKIYYNKKEFVITSYSIHYTKLYDNNHIGDTGFFAAQPKLKVGKPGDKYEQEADRVAEEVVNSTPETSTFFSPARSLGIQTKPIARSITPFVQKYAEEEEAQAKFEIQRQEEEEEEAQTKLEIQRQEEEEEELVQAQPMEEEEEELQAKSQNDSNPRHTTENLLQNSKGGGSSMDQSIVITSYSIHYTKLYDDLILMILR